VKLLYNTDNGCFCGSCFLSSQSRQVSSGYLQWPLQCYLKAHPGILDLEPHSTVSSLQSPASQPTSQPTSSSTTSHEGSPRYSNILYQVRHPASQTCYAATQSAPAGCLQQG
jgi:hypothetical protein